MVKGRGRKGVTMLVSEEVCKNVVEWKNASTRLMWAKVKYGMKTWASACAY